MREWIRDLWNALLLKPSVFDALRARHDAFLQGLIVIAVVALLAGLPAFVVDVVEGLQPGLQEANIAGARAGLLRALDAVGPVLAQLGVPGGTREQMAAEAMQNLELGMRIGAEMDALPTVLPKPLGRTLRALGGWLSTPFGGALPLTSAALGTWLGYGVWVMLAAKLLGGRGTLHGFFGTTALYAVPHLLGLFALVPVAGSILGLLGFLWGLAIYVRATAVSHEISLERALLAVLLPALAAAALLILLAAALAGFIVLSAAV